MKNFLRNIKSDKTTYIAFSVAIIILVTIFIFVLSFYGRLPPFVPVFNQLAWGEERLGTPIALFIPILIAFFIFIFNLIVSELIYERIPLVARMFAGTSLLIAALTFIFVIKTVILIL